VLLSDEDFQSVKVPSSSVMNIEKFVAAGTIDPLYYDTSYYLAPDGEAGRDVYAILCEAIEETGRVALSRVVIAQRERTIALRPMEGGLVAHTLHEQRDINEAKAVFEGQLIDRQTTTYDPSDIEDRYEMRLRAMIDAKLKGEGIEDEETEEPDRGNVVDLMAALRKSLGEENTKPAKPGNAPTKAEGAPAAKTPKKRTAATPALKPTRKRA
jgi:DNA end-binding protein Ku